MFVCAAIRQCEVNSLLVLLVIAFFDVTKVFLFAVMWSLRFPFFWCCVGHYMRFTTLRTRPVNSRCTSSSMPDLLTNFTSLDAGSQAGFLRCSHAKGQYSSQDGYVKQIRQILKDVSGLPLNEHEFGESTITYFSLHKLTEIVISFCVTHFYMECRPSRFQNAGPFHVHWTMKTLSKWKLTLRCFNVNTLNI